MIFFIGMNVIKANSQSIFEKKAVCFEDVSNDAQVEFNRKKRMSAGNFQNLKAFAPLLFKPNAAAFHFHFAQSIALAYTLLNINSICSFLPALFSFHIIYCCYIRFLPFNLQPFLGQST
jgi:hypothetical protein